MLFIFGQIPTLRILVNEEVNDDQDAKESHHHYQRVAAVTGLPAGKRLAHVAGIQDCVDSQPNDDKSETDLEGEIELALDNVKTGGYENRNQRQIQAQRGKPAIFGFHYLHLRTSIDTVPRNRAKAVRLK